MFLLNQLNLIGNIVGRLNVTFSVRFFSVVFLLAVRPNIAEKSTVVSSVLVYPHVQNVKSYKNSLILQ